MLTRCSFSLFLSVVRVDMAIMTTRDVLHVEASALRARVAVVRGNAYAITETAQLCVVQRNPAASFRSLLGRGVTQRLPRAPTDDARLRLFEQDRASAFRQAATRRGRVVTLDGGGLANFLASVLANALDTCCFDKKGPLPRRSRDEPRFQARARARDALAHLSRSNRPHEGGAAPRPRPAPLGAGFRGEPSATPPLGLGRKKESRSTGRRRRCRAQPAVRRRTEDVLRGRGATRFG